ncbi:hypothetical protein AAVH_14388 [Aphelenchoides avenae]|nr:hypothetical protein AAVH_14388 [Aphelenchus avenae]
MSRATVLTLLCVIPALGSGYGYKKQSYGGGGGYGGGQGSAGDGKDGCRRSVEHFLKAYSAVYATQNAAGVAAFYSKDTVVPTNQFGQIFGRDATRNFYQVVFEQGSNNALVNHTIIEPDRHCKFALVVGLFVLSSSDNPQGVVTRKGTFWEILKNENQVWQIDMQRLIFD